MNKIVWQNIGRFILLMLVQLLVLNYINIGGYIMPMLYVLFVLMLPTDTPRVAMLFIAFGTGLLMDVMNNMLGFHALACIVVVMLRILFADRILTRGEPIAISTPSVYSVSPQYFIAYLLLLTTAFYLVFFFTELFGFRSLGGLLVATVGSSIVTSLLAILYQLIFIKREEI